MNEIMPKGFENWTKYYQHKAKVAKIKQFGEYLLGVILILGIIAADGITNFIFLRSL